MGALPLGERRRRVRPTARGGDRAHSRGALGSEGLPSRPSWGGILAPPAPHPRCRRGGARGRSRGGWSGELIPRVSASPRVCGGCVCVTEASTRSEAFHPRALPPPRDRPAAGRSPFIPQIQTSSSGEVPAARGLCPALPAPAGAAGRDYRGGLGPAEGCSPLTPQIQNSCPAGNEPKGGDGGGGRAEQLVPELRLPSFKLGEFK